MDSAYPCFALKGASNFQGALNARLKPQKQKTLILDAFPF